MSKSKKVLLWSWYALVALLVAGAAVGPARKAWAAVNMSTVAASGNYLATPGTPGFMPGADKTKLDALPATYATIAALNAKAIPIHGWGMTASPATTADRWVNYGLPSTAPQSNRRSSSQAAAFDMTCTSISALFVEAVQATDTLTFCLEYDDVVTALCTAINSGTTRNTGTGSIAVQQGHSLSIKVNQSGSAASTANTGTRVSIGCKSTSAL